VKNPLFKLLKPLDRIHPSNRWMIAGGVAAILVAMSGGPGVVLFRLLFP
jgi:hypothetical protein